MEPAVERPQRTHPRIEALDGIRGLAILLVMLHHFFQLYSPESQLLDAVVFGVAESGWFGVDLFFVLSGFLITGILYDAKGSSGYFRNFFARRTLRIFPLYYAALILFFVVFPLIPHALAQEYVADSEPDQVWFWMYLTNFRIALNGDWYDYLVPNVFWSLAIEEQFYLVWPVVVYLFSRRALIRVCIGLIGVALIVRTAFSLVGVEPVVTFVITPARMDCLAAGALIALLIRGDLDPAVRTQWARRTFLLVGTVLLMVAIPDGGLHWTPAMNHTVGLSLVALFFASMITWVIGAAHDNGLRRLFETRVMKSVGKYSYSMYIFHGPAGSFAKVLYDPATSPLFFGSALPRMLVYSLIAGLITFIIAWSTWHVLEKRMLALQSRFR